MGLFDFASDFGNSIFGDDDEEASDKLLAHIEEDNPGVTGLQVTVEDGIATLSGEAESASAYEKAVLMAGNALGIETVQAGDLSVLSPNTDESIDDIFTEPSEETTTTMTSGEVISSKPINTNESYEPINTNVSYYVIQSGDSLWKIAEQFYGNGSKYQQLFEENREVIKNPDLIFEGQKIRIPVG